MAWVILVKRRNFLNKSLSKVQPQSVGEAGAQAVVAAGFEEHGGSCCDLDHMPSRLRRRLFFSSAEPQEYYYCCLPYKITKSRACVSSGYEPLKVSHKLSQYLTEEFHPPTNNPSIPNHLTFTQPNESIPAIFFKSSSPMIHSGVVFLNVQN